MSEPVYLDYAASTPVDPAVATALAEALASPSTLANPSAIHAAGRTSESAVERAAVQLASLLNCAPEQLTWTSGATEADNLAILGAAHYRSRKGKHVVTMLTEHKAVTDAFRALEKEGYEVTWLSPDEQGLLDPQQLDDSLRDDTQLVSIMHVNNETGVVQDIERLGAMCRARSVLFPVDAAQSAGKLPIDLQALPVDLLSLSAHKMYGPKGIGALYIADRPGCHVEPLMFGGGQQKGIRPGTLPVPLIVAQGRAAEIAAQSMSEDYEYATRLRERLWSAIGDLDGVRLNGHPQKNFPGILNVSADGVEGESLVLALEPLCVATGSACNSRNQEPSAVLRATGLSDLEAQGAIRFSFGRFTTDAEIDLAASTYRAAITRLRGLAPAA